MQPGNVSQYFLLKACNTALVDLTKAWAYTLYPRLFTNIYNFTHTTNWLLYQILFSYFDVGACIFKENVLIEKFNILFEITQNKQQYGTKITCTDPT